MNNCSSAYTEIINIINTAKHHKENCFSSDCGVALYLLGMTAKRLENSTWLSERAEIKRLIKETDWT